MAPKCAPTKAVNGGRGQRRLPANALRLPLFQRGETHPPPAKVTIETISRIRSGVPMKLGSLKEGGRDGTLVVVSRDLSQAVRATGIASTLQQALEDWSNIAPRLVALSDAPTDRTAAGAFPPTGRAPGR